MYGSVLLDRREVVVALILRPWPQADSDKTRGSLHKVCYEAPCYGREGSWGIMHYSTHRTVCM